MESGSRVYHPSLNLIGNLQPHPPVNTLAFGAHIAANIAAHSQIPLPPQILNPANNDTPLDFKNTRAKLPAKVKSSLLTDDENIDKVDKLKDHKLTESREWTFGKEKDPSLHVWDKEISSGCISPGNLIATSNDCAASINTSAGIVGSSPADLTATWNTSSSNLGYNMMNLMNDPTVMSMMGLGQFGLLNMPGGIIPETPLLSVGKEIIHFKKCTLFPPNPNVPLPTTRERPPGCRTVFVGGLPENISEDIIREVFERCGEITTIRMSKKNFCHIRFECESYVDNAIYLSGFRIRLDSNGDACNIGRLHVDYAQARDDQYEYECRQRQLQREQRHRERLEQERLRPPSPPPVMHYTDHEAQSIAEKLKERGDCNKRNAGIFYSMIQSSNSHVRRLMNEKVQFEEELQKAKDVMKQRMQGILMQFSQIERTFQVASLQKVWDHFTKAQRKNIDMWKKQAGEIMNMQLEEVLNERTEEEMEVSDSEEDSSPIKKKNRSDQILSMKEENDNLRCQLEAYKNEVDLVRADLKSDMEQKDKEILDLKDTLQTLNHELEEMKSKILTDKEKLKEYQYQLEEDQSSNEISEVAEDTSSKTDQSDKLIDLCKKLDNYETSKDFSSLSHRKNTAKHDLRNVSFPKPVFHSSHVKKNQSLPPETNFPQHEEIIKYINDSWKAVLDEYNSLQSKNGEKPTSSIIYYEESEINSQLKDFVPFDLEAWWGRRMYQNLMQS